MQDRAKLACAYVGVMSICLFIALIFLLGESERIWLLFTLLALALSSSIVTGARWLDGEIRLQPKRRGEKGHSPAGASILLWLACFGAIEAAFLLAPVLNWVGSIFIDSNDARAEEIVINGELPRLGPPQLDGGDVPNTASDDPLDENGTTEEPVGLGAPQSSNDSADGGD
jgi:hypothetical protein